MSIWLCRQEQVKHPYYIEMLGVHIYSSQELAYVIGNYPLLVLDDFLNDSLLEFLRDELNQGFLVLKLERWLRAGEDADEALMMILQECDYYTNEEISRFRQQVAEIRKKHPAEYQKMKADALFSMGQYGRAAKGYEKLLEYPTDEWVDDRFLGSVWNNLASCYARMFQFQKAYDAYERAYLRTNDLGILMRIYYLTKLDPSLKLGDRLRLLITEEMAEDWEKNRMKAQEHAEHSEALEQLQLLFGRDSIRRQAGEAQLLKRWKQEYRGMV